MRISIPILSRNKNPISTSLLLSNFTRLVNFFTPSASRRLLLSVLIPPPVERQQRKGLEFIATLKPVKLYIPTPLPTLPALHLAPRSNCTRKRPTSLLPPLPTSSSSLFALSPPMLSIQRNRLFLHAHMLIMNEVATRRVQRKLQSGAFLCDVS